MKCLCLPSSIFSVYKNGHTDVCLSVGMWSAIGNPNSCTNLDKILHTYTHMSKEGFGVGLTPTLPPWVLGVLKN